MIKKYLSLITILTGISFVVVSMFVSSLGGFGFPPETVTNDEPADLASAYTLLKSGEFQFDSVHPPLMKGLAALPLLLLEKQLYPKSLTSKDFTLGHDLLYSAALPAQIVLTLSRFPAIFMTSIFLLILRKIFKRLFSLITANYLFLLACFLPDVLAHGKLVTTDMGVTIFLFLSVYFFNKYFFTKQKANLFFCCVCASFALLTKFSAVFLLAALISYLGLLWAVKKQINYRAIYGALSNLLLVFLISVTTIYLSYLLLTFRNKTNDLPIIINQ
jgi:4-amino-4-deoxy-L-arabinose transferase-like glycosyltransferase